MLAPKGSAVMNQTQKDFLGGIENYRIGLLPQAKMMFLDCIKDSPRHAEAHNLLGIVCHRRKEYRQAFRYLKTAIALKPGVAAYCNNAGVTAHALGYHDHAKAFFHRAIALNPVYPDPYNNLGNVFLDLFLFDDAVLCYKKALTFKPDFAEACFNLALCLERKQYFIEAIYYYRQTLKIRPDHLKSHQRLADLLPGQNRSDEAREHQAEAEHLYPQQKPFFINTPTFMPSDYSGLRQCCTNLRAKKQGRQG
jgi:tetratricopeptide (TPR) repeat protein